MISIVIPTFNRRQLLGQAVRSVLDQRFRDWELIVVDDGSSDGTRHDFEFSGLSSRVRYIRQEHRGVSAARNLGIHAARYEWIAFLDSDDYWLEDKLQGQFEGLEKHPRYRAVQSEEIWIRSGRRVNPAKHHRKYSGWIFHHCVRLCLISPSSVLLHRSLLDETGLFDESFPVCEDYDLWLRLAALHPVLTLPERTVVKRGGHADQLSRSRWGLDRYRVRSLLKVVRSGHLTPQQEKWACREAARKCGILESGFEKRGKSVQAAYYRGVCRSLGASPAPGRVSPRRRPGSCGRDGFPITFATRSPK